MQDGRTDGRIGEPAAAGDSHGISIPARPATSYSMIYHSEKRVYARTHARRALKRMYVRWIRGRRRRRRILGCFRIRFTIIIRRHTSTGVPYVCTEVGYVGTERYLGSTSRSPSLRPLPSFSHSPYPPSSLPAPRATVLLCSSLFCFSLSLGPGLQSNRVAPLLHL